MKATLIDKRSFVVISKKNITIIIKMDLYKIHGKNANQHPEGFRFSWIAFNSEDPVQKILFDSHPPKGPHFHIDNDPVGISIEWSSLELTEQLFFNLVAHHFKIDPEELK